MPIDPFLVSCTPEQRLIMNMLGASPNGGRWGALPDLLAAVSWDRFADDADGMVQPYLHWACERPPFAGHIPDSVLRQFASARAATRIRNLQWASELRGILEAFRNTPIEVMFVKGSVLQRTAYPDPSTRPMSDADMLVRRRADMPVAREILKRLGFHSRTSADSHTPDVGTEVDREAYFLKQVGDRTLLLEVHTELEMHAGFEAPPWEARLDAHGSDGIVVSTLDSHTALRHLCFHLAKHGYEHGLMWLLDIRLFIEQSRASIRWDELMEECAPSARPLLGFTLSLAADWLGADVPERVQAMIPSDKKAAAMPLAWQQMWEYGRSRQPLNVAVVALSGNPRRLWAYLGDRLRRWTAPMPDRKTHRLLLMAKRLRTDFQFLRARVRDGGFRLSSLRTARQSDRRFEQLRTLLWPPGRK